MSQIIISSGITSTGLVAESGDVIIIEAGGTLVDGVSILTDNIELGERIAAGDYAGWGFTVEENVL